MSKLAADDLPPIEFPEGLDPWLARALKASLEENKLLLENGALQAASARHALIRSILSAASGWLEEEVDVATAAELTGRCEETIRRAVREGRVPDRRPAKKGRHRVTRADVTRLAGPSADGYDPIADAQDIARRRRAV